MWYSSYFSIVTVGVIGLCKSDKNIVRNKNIVVWFDPFVSIRDTFEPYHYNKTTLLPLLDTVGSKFSQIMVHMTEFELDDNQWNVLVPEVVAEMNTLKSESQVLSPYLQVWISFHYIKAAYDDEDHANQYMSLLSQMCAKANKVFPGTVFALTFHFSGGFREQSGYLFAAKLLSILHRNKIALPESYQYQVGVMLDIEDCQSSTIDHARLLKLLVPYLDIIFIDGVSQLGKLDAPALNTMPEIIQWMVSEAQQCRKLVNRAFEKKNFCMGFVTGWPDTRLNGSINYANLVTFWQTLIEKGHETNITFILDRAFDTPYSPRQIEETRGWWRLQENQTYNSPINYIFEEKVDLINEAANRSISRTWLETPSTFDQSSVGVGAFSHSYFRNKKTLNNIWTNLYLRIISSVFGKVLVNVDLVGDDNTKSDESSCSSSSTLQTLIQLNITKSHTNISLILALQSFYLKLNDFEALLHYNCLTNTINKNLDTTELILLQTKKDNTWENEEIFLTKLLTQTSQRDPVINLGVIFSLKSWCLQEKNLTLTFEDAITALGITVAISWTRLTSNPERYWQQLKVLLGLCRKRIDSFHRVRDLLFIMDWSDIITVETNLVKLTSYVKFWEDLNSWAKTQENTTVILGEAFDTSSVTGEYLPNGWWSMVSNENYKKTADDTESLKFVNKKDQALELFKEQLRRKEQMAFTTGLGLTEILAISLALLAILFSVVTVHFCIWRRSKRYQFISKQKLDEFFKGRVPNPESMDMKEIVDLAGFSANHLNAWKYKKDLYEIKKEFFKIDDTQDSYLGDGEFGKVCKAKIYRQEDEILEVAAKTVKYPPNGIALTGLLSEIKVLSYIGRHENIVQLIGAYTAEIHKGKLYVFLELCHIGSLHKYLKGLRNCEEDENEATGDENSEESFEETESLVSTEKSEILDEEALKEFFQWTLEIANGMEYLAKKHVVHGDIATRNILLNANRKVKISDFGLSRRMYNYKYYSKAGNEPLPWRWMAPESLRFSMFTEKTDAWAFGVAIWEIYTLGETPYPGISWNATFANQLENGLRLTKPNSVDKRVYSVMNQCWNINPTARLTFSEILVKLKSRTENTTGGGYLSVETL